MRHNIETELRLRLNASNTVGRMLGSESNCNDIRISVCEDSDDQYTETDSGGGCLRLPVAAAGDVFLFVKYCCVLLCLCFLELVSLCAFKQRVFY